MLALFWMGLGCLSSSASKEAAVDPESRRVVGAATVLGAEGLYGAQVYRGLRYAAPPLGPR